MDRDKQELTERQQAFLEMELDDMGLSVRAYNYLKGAGVKTYKQLLSYDPYELLKIKNLGKKTINEVGELVSEYGLSLGCFYSKNEENPFGPLIHSENPSIRLELKKIHGSGEYVRINSVEDLKRYIDHFVVEIQGVLVDFPVDSVNIVFKK